MSSWTAFGEPCVTSPYRRLSPAKPISRLMAPPPAVSDGNALDTTSDAPGCLGLDPQMLLQQQERLRVTSLQG